MSLVNMRKRMPIMNLILPFMVPSDLGAKLAAHWAHTVAMIESRIAKKDTITRTDFFLNILESGMMEEELLQQNANILIIAGSETTATALAGCLYHLMHNDNCLATLQKEVRSAFNRLDAITGDATQKLPYLHARVEEALRIYPPVAFGLQRVSLVSSQNWTISHDERYWQDPDSFQPERWLNQGLGDNRDAFQRFSLGPRACTSINLAYLEIRVILAKMVWQYDFELLSKDLDWERDSMMHVLWQKPAMNMRFLPRADFGS
jgi:cytochrome P450